jgi:oligosaccharide repeat unit polymerase
LKIFILIYLPFFLIVFSLVLTYSGDILLVALRTGMIQTCTNIVTCSLPCLLSVFLIKYIEFKQKKDLIFFSLFFLLALFMGRRSITLQPITGIMLMFFIHKGKKLRLIYPIIIAIAFVFIVFWLDTLRHGESTSGETLIEKVLYGNTFCDVRDFSLILSGRNEEFLYGKTYLAGLMSFIPSSLSDFRMDWSFGHVSLKMAGLYDGGWTVHGGLRGGIFCEGYLNFGYIGIIILAIVYGYVNEWINKQNTFYSKRRMFSSAYSCKIKGTFISILMISSSAWMLYGLLLPIVIIYYVKSKNFVLGLFKPVNYK